MISISLVSLAVTVCGFATGNTQTISIGTGMVFLCMLIIYRQQRD